MRINKASLCLSALLVLGGCPDPNPPPDNTPRLSTVTVTCAPASISATRPVQCTASAKDQNGQPFEVSGYTWTSSNESVAKVNATGKVTTLVEGSVTLSASATENGAIQQGQTTLMVTQAQPTVHTTPITTNEIWRETENPHVVNGNLEVNGASTPTLTLEAGTVVRFGRDSGLFVGVNSPGELVVNGNQDSRVLLTADSESPQPGHWKGVHLKERTSSASRISHATIEYAGALNGAVRTANLNVTGNYDGRGPYPVINAVVVQKSSGSGVVMVGSAAFGSGSTPLTARDNGGYAISIEANDVRTIPTGGTFSGNTQNAVEISGGNVGTTQTWPNLGIPYAVRSTINVGSYSTGGATLTLLAGTTLLFDRDTGFFVGADNLPGALLAVGTAAAPIRFDLNEPPTAPRGKWYGLLFRLANGSKLDHVSISRAGYPGIMAPGNLNVYREIGAFVTNSTFSNSLGCGIAVSTGSATDTTRVTTDFTLTTYNNTFIDNNDGDRCTTD